MSILKQAGYKLTAPRKAVIEVLQNHPGHLSHDQILEEGRKICPQLGRATVYRTMELLVELNMVRPLYLADATQRFIPAAGGHHHLVCSHCGAVIEFNHCTTTRLAQELAEKYHFQVHSHLLEFWGVCQNCLDKSNGHRNGKKFATH